MNRLIITYGYVCIPLIMKWLLYLYRVILLQMEFSYTMMQVLPGIDLNASPAVQSVLDVLTGQKKYGQCVLTP